MIAISPSHWNQPCLFAATQSRLYESPARPWPLSGAAEAEISAAFASRDPIETQLKSAATALSKGRIELVANRSVQARLLSQVAEYYYKPTIVCGIELVDESSLTAGLRRFVAESTGYEGEKLPSSKEYRDLRLVRGGTFVQQIQDWSVYHSLYALTVSQHEPARFNALTDSIIIPPSLAQTDDLGLLLICTKAHELEHCIRFHAGDLLDPYVLTRGYFIRLALMPFCGAFLFYAGHHDETHCIGAEWELVKRLPDHVREAIRARIAENFSKLGLDVDEVRHLPVDQQLPILTHALLPDLLHAPAHLRNLIYGMDALRTLDIPMTDKKAYIRAEVQYIIGDSNKRFIHTFSHSSLSVKLPWISDALKLLAGATGWWMSG